ncbi:MAG: cold-shock protein [Erysipelotrichaceae bacterium]
MTGKVKSFNKVKGYGFIVCEDNSELFFHFSDLVMDGFKTIEPDTAVEFVVSETDRGLQAKEVVKV